MRTEFEEMLAHPPPARRPVVRRGRGREEGEGELTFDLGK